MKKTALLLINLGTPDSPNPSDVKTYLTEFLTDGRVIDLPWLWRQLLVRGIIIPKRYKQSADSYKKIWSKEGSPLLSHTLQLKEKLQEELGESYIVEAAMRYRHPSLKQAIQRLLSESISHLIIFPLFPQYASATTGSIKQKTMEILKNYLVIPKVTFINQFYDHPSYVEAVTTIGNNFNLKNYDHVLFSYHGLPKSQIQKADRQGNCLKNRECCLHFEKHNPYCYSAQCIATTKAIASKLKINADQYSICFQSRLGKDPWLEPYASETIHHLAAQGIKNLLVFSPSFVCDCLETIYEIGYEYALEFKQAGGQNLDLVPCLNSHPSWVKAIKDIIS